MPGKLGDRSSRDPSIRDLPGEGDLAGGSAVQGREPEHLVGTAAAR